MTGRYLRVKAAISTPIACGPDRLTVVWLPGVAVKGGGVHGVRTVSHLHWLWRYLANSVNTSGRQSKWANQFARGWSVGCASLLGTPSAIESCATAC